MDLASSASVCLAFSFAAPAGLLGAGLAVASGTAQNPLHVYNNVEKNQLTPN